MDKLKSVQVKLPLKTGIINVQYFDSLNENLDDELKTKNVRATVIASHGTPGSHVDFKYMIPKLISSGFRVICINWPGFGITQSPDEYDHTNVERAQLLSSFIKALNLEKLDVVIGHSSGCYPLPLFFVENPDICNVGIFINPGGSTPHRGIRPYWIVKYLALFLSTFLAPVINYFLYFFTVRILGLRISDPNQAGIMTRIIANIDFIYLNAVILNLKESKKPPIVLFCGRKDQMVEYEKSIEYAEKLGCHESNRIFDVETGENLHNLKQNIFNADGSITEHCTIMFAQGTHYLQKFEADSICKLTSTIIDNKS